MFDDEKSMILQDKEGNDIEIFIPETPQSQIVMEFSSTETTHLEKPESNSNNKK